jgi:hypothetical protein
MFHESRSYTCRDISESLASESICGILRDAVLHKHYSIKWKCDNVNYITSTFCQNTDSTIEINIFTARINDKNSHSDECAISQDKLIFQLNMLETIHSLESLVNDFEENESTATTKMDQKIHTVFEANAAAMKSQSEKLEIARRKKQMYKKMSIEATEIQKELHFEIGMLSEKIEKQNKEINRLRAKNVFVCSKAQTICKKYKKIKKQKKFWYL